MKTLEMNEKLAKLSTPILTAKAQIAKGEELEMVLDILKKRETKKTKTKEAASEKAAIEVGAILADMKVKREAAEAKKEAKKTKVKVAKVATKKVADVETKKVAKVATVKVAKVEKEEAAKIKAEKLARLEVEQLAKRLKKEEALKAKEETQAKKEKMKEFQIYNKLSPNDIKEKAQIIATKLEEFLATPQEDLRGKIVSYVDPKTFAKNFGIVTGMDIDMRAPVWVVIIKEDVTGNRVSKRIVNVEITGEVENIEELQEAFSQTDSVQGIIEFDPAN